MQLIGTGKRTLPGCGEHRRRWTWILTMDLRKAVSTLLMEAGLPSGGLGRTVHFNKEPAGARNTELSHLDLQTFVAAMILDGN